jgi:hypothetical protein
MKKLKSLLKLVYYLDGVKIATRSRETPPEEFTSIRITGTLYRITSVLKTKDVIRVDLIDIRKLDKLFEKETE